jgi:hypothetical protein
MVSMTARTAFNFSNIKEIRLWKLSSRIFSHSSLREISISSRSDYGGTTVLNFPETSQTCSIGLQSGGYAGQFIWSISKPLIYNMRSTTVVPLGFQRIILNEIKNRTTTSTYSQTVKLPLPLLDCWMDPRSDHVIQSVKESLKQLQSDRDVVSFNSCW